MEKFTDYEGLVVSLARANIDTDAIIPKQFLKSIRRTGFGPYLFDEWRYLDHGEPDMDCSQRPKNPDFVLNQPRYANATILLTERNFGCGSSREHAPWALLGAGFKVIIAPSFAEIFYNNCMKNGLLPIVLAEPIVMTLMQEVEATPGYTLFVALDKQIVRKPDNTELSFNIEPAYKTALLKGLDEIGQTLESASAIHEYEARRKQAAPWLF